MSKPGADPSSGMSLGDALRLPKRQPAWRRREAQSGSRKKLTCSGNERPRCRRRAPRLTSFPWLRGGHAGGRLVRDNGLAHARHGFEALPNDERAVGAVHILHSQRNGLEVSSGFVGERLTLTAIADAPGT